MEMDHHTLSLTIEGLAAERGGRVVVAGLAFSLSPGEALTLRGANGTGKTSILRAVAGFSDPAEGTVRFDLSGEEADASETRATAIHWLGGDDALADKLTLKESLSFWSSLLGGGATDELPARLGLSGLEDTPLGKMSTGQRRRAGIGRLLCAPRPLWLLDEPMSGLDDQGRELLLSIIAEHRATGGILLMASHDEGIPGCPVLRLSPAVAA
ncbi:heme ABC exporter ATP-binding protein CcmA [Parvularcula marina]|nr:heme ABC exporter ATP-binding protein CcmA [Parvularcula marina]